MSCRITSPEEIAKVEAICREAGQDLPPFARIPGEREAAVSEAKSDRKTANQAPSVRGNKARARHQPGRMNKTETAYAAHLTSLGFRWWFEAVTLRLADDVRYTADFLVVADGTLELHDVKAWWKKAGKVGWQEDSRVKWKTAAEFFPLFAFVAAWCKEGVWEEERYR